MACLRNLGGGGCRSAFLNDFAQRILRWADSHALSRPHQIQGNEWMLKMEVFDELRCRWPVIVDLFAISANPCCSLYFSPFRSPQALGTDAFLHSWDHLLVYAFPPWALNLQVLQKLCSSSGILITLITPYWPQRPWFPDLLVWQWIVQSPFLTVQIFSDSRTSIVVISGFAGCRFLRGDYPVICLGCWLLCLCSCPGRVGSPSVFVHQLPAQVVGVPGLV